MDKALVISFIIYIVAMVGAGVLTYTLSKTFADFMLAGRKLGSWVTAISAQASDMSGWLLIGVPGEAIKKGMGIVWTAIGCVMGNFFNWTMLSRRLRRYSEVLDALTIPDFLATRFHGQSHKTIRVACLLTIVIFYSIYIGAQFKAAGETLDTTFESLTYHHSVIIAATIIIFYTMMGGFIAVAWTDFIQGMLMVFVLVVLPVIGIIQLGSVTEIVDSLAARDPNLLKVSQGLSGWDLFGTLVLGGLGWALGYPGMPHITVRYMAIKEEKELRKSTLISICWVTLALWGAISVGWVGYAELGGELGNLEHVLPQTAKTFLPGWIAGIVIAAIAAAIMSTVDSQILVLSSAVVEDFYRRLFHQEASERFYLGFSRVITIAIGMVGVVLCWNSERSVFGYVSDAWAGLAAGFGPALIMSLLWRRANGWGIAAGMFSGISTVLIWRNFPAVVGHICKVVPGLPPSLAESAPDLSALIWELVPAFGVALLFIVFVSLATGRPPEGVEEEFDMVSDYSKKLETSAG